MKKIVYLIIFLFAYLPIYATHNRAGEITYRQISPMTFEITIWTYTSTKPGVVADRPELEVFFGDNTMAIVERDEQNYLPNFYKRNRYTFLHTYPGTGTYSILVMDPNRNQFVNNIPQSQDVVFAIKTTLQINPIIGSNSTPILLNPPYDQASLDRTFIHNPGAFDPDGDSLSYKLSVCLGPEGKPISGFIQPSASKSITVDPVTGDLIWDAPNHMGIYNVAIEIEEWRFGVKIGSLIRDMQIEVLDSDNHPPKLDPLNNICVMADSVINLIIRGSEPDNENITLKASGGPFMVANSPATFTQPKTAPIFIIDTFTWKTNCSHVRKQPYTVIFKAEDDNPEQILVDYKNVNITIVAPSVTNFSTTPSNSTILLKWTPCKCTEAAGYKVFRKKRKYGFSPQNCETGVPEYTGYELIDQFIDVGRNFYLDDNKGSGLVQGYEYCYMIVAYFADGSESYASVESCAELIRGVPLFTNVSVSTTNKTNGAIHLKWIKPTQLDTSIIKGPFRYTIFPSNDLYGLAYRDPFHINGFDNTSYIDTMLNTTENPRIYKMGLFNFDQTLQQWKIVGIPDNASSVFLSLKAGNNKLTLSYNHNIPWTNKRYVIYRKNPGSLTFDSVGSTIEKKYTDGNLQNGLTYCYKIKTVGEYQVNNTPKPLLNFSQEVCGVPMDTIPPCVPNLVVESKCTELFNQLTWRSHDTCDMDISKYKIYYSNSIDGLPVLIDSVTALSYIHKPIETLAGCYYVTAVDGAGNESKKQNKVCIDLCSYYDLPNAFTPDGDGINDTYKPFPYKFVEKVDMKIYSRWGNLVFETSNPEIIWDGKDKTSGTQVADGIYYYVCDVYEQRLSGVEVRNITGFIQVFGSSSKNKP